MTIDLTGFERLTGLQRAFVTGIVAGKNPSRAYRDAGYAVSQRSVASVGAKRLLTNPAVQAAIAEQREAQTTRQALATRTTVTTDRTLLEAAWRVYNGACEDGAWSAATQALVVLGRLTGLLQDGKQRGKQLPSVGVQNNLYPPGIGPLTDYSVEQLQSLSDMLKDDSVTFTVEGAFKAIGEPQG
jgi:hypothetical protein|tara:strand:- start:421 stop:975 length:555 start_codon:yes stop_codon:yes gene_type:complete